MTVQALMRQSGTQGVPQAQGVPGKGQIYYLCGKERLHVRMSSGIYAAPGPGPGL